MIKHSFETMLVRHLLIALRSQIFNIAIVIMNSMLTNRHFAMILFNKKIKILNIILINDVIRIHACHVLPLCFLDAIISCI